MKHKINEYTEKPELSQQAREFIESSNSGPIPDNIRNELELFLKLNAPFVEKAKIDLEKQFEKVFSK